MWAGFRKKLPALQISLFENGSRRFKVWLAFPKRQDGRLRIEAQEKNMNLDTVTWPLRSMTPSMPLTSLSMCPSLGKKTVRRYLQRAWVEDSNTQCVYQNILCPPDTKSYHLLSVHPKFSQTYTVVHPYLHTVTIQFSKYFFTVCSTLVLPFKRLSVARADDRQNWMYELFYTPKETF